MDLLTVILLFLVSFFAELYGVIIGGSSLLILPSLIALGVPPHTAIGTRRTGSILNPMIGIYNLNKHKMVGWHMAVPLILVGIIGTSIGLFFFFKINEIMLKSLIGIVSLFGLFFMLIKKDIGIKKTKNIHKHKKWVGFLLLFLISIYMGFYGALSGTLLSYILIIFFGMTFLESAGTRKILSITRALITVPIFIIAGKVVFLYALILMAGGSIGSYIGSKHAPKLGNEKIRYAFIAVTLFAIFKMFF